MSHIDYRSHKLNRNQARKLINEIANSPAGQIIYSKHALKRLSQRELTTGDVLNIIKSPDARIEMEPEFEGGSYRYRLETQRIAVIIAFNSDTSFVIVTAWRK